MGGKQRCTRSDGRKRKRRKEKVQGVLEERLSVQPGEKAESECA